MKLIVRFGRRARTVLSRAAAYLFATRKEAQALLGILIAALLFMGLLIHYPGHRTQLIAFVAALGAFIVAIPELLPKAPLVRWVTAAVCGLCVGLGTWYTAVELDHQREIVQAELDKQRAEGREQARKIEVLHSAYRATTGNVPAPLRDQAVLEIARLMRNRVAPGRTSDILDLADLVAEVYPDNGHALYFAGEAWRIGGRSAARPELNVENMRGEFKKYLALTAQMQDALEGDASVCYERPGGFCGERTAWILHMMANDAFR